MFVKTNYEWWAGRVKMNQLIFLVRHPKYSISVSVCMYILCCVFRVYLRWYMYVYDIDIFEDYVIYELWVRDCG